MKISKLCLHSFIHSLGVFIYVGLVTLVMGNAESIFGEMDNYFGPMLFLMLLVLSATIVGLLVFLKPVIMYLDGQKKDALKLLLSTVGWLLGFTILLVVVLIALSA
ncbi:MAG: hypothetical protein COT91_00640 [Candidatus Doudnabacteria bacterium CG10_big_fil_rev_8_21_14_0_10_41_10]|uniref:Uncharacterized protein n=1 Tax=Candidatus Doudnabacteria bacterium CG10_big_fil_rev_8_21_14_0_10_41_10 TaxID=1974551 RepID=A0A2H0VH01_9BACT|nr:MAG: hypothetical protein COT91_00640 [Candidatus Doudnabacteria bacterium CG10_big_fil_rev_8_21_14_0_10_41_10]